MNHQFEKLLKKNPTEDQALSVCSLPILSGGEMKASSLANSRAYVLEVEILAKSLFSPSEDIISFNSHRFLNGTVTHNLTHIHTIHTWAKCIDQGRSCTHMITCVPISYHANNHDFTYFHYATKCRRF